MSASAGLSSSLAKISRGRARVDMVGRKSAVRFRSAANSRLTRCSYPWSNPRIHCLGYGVLTRREVPAPLLPPEKLCASLLASPTLCTLYFAHTSRAYWMLLAVLLRKVEARRDHGLLLIFDGG
jgi:hypothetical protein